MKEKNQQKSALHFQLVSDKLISNHECLKVCLIHSICAVYLERKLLL